ncbi:MAG: hypothetical protein CSA20_09600 [Deltaproteobacteria bacterium]|nr:MAG: hypothetical protein CSA20_09600 [Deltaproteobacteria bacterium]
MGKKKSKAISLQDYDLLSIDTYNALSPHLSPSEDKRVKLILGTASSAIKNYSDDVTIANRKAWLEAEADVNSYVGDLVKKYLLPPEEEPSDVFSNKLEVWEYLVNEAGYKISRTQFYQHCKDGLLRPEKISGSYLLKNVEKYATLHLRRSDSGEIESERERRIREERLEISLEKEKVLLQKEKTDLAKKQGKYIARADFEAAIVSRAVAFMAHLNHTVISVAADCIELVDGDQQKAPQLVDFLNRKIEQRMADFAKNTEIEVIFETND